MENEVHTLRLVCVVIECLAFLISLSNLTVLWSRLMAPGADMDNAFDDAMLLLPYSDKQGLIYKLLSEIIIIRVCIVVLLNFLE